MDETKRFFSQKVKNDCWKKAEKIPGRDPKRWRMDFLGNIVSHKLRGCGGCFCHDYDHIVPHSKGGNSDLSNCQILQSKVNNFKGNRSISNIDLLNSSCAKSFSNEELDFLEICIYGNIERSEVKCKVYSFSEIINIKLGELNTKFENTIKNCFE